MPQYSIQTAKEALDDVIQKSRIHLYKPIQIAEILYRDRVSKDINLADKETYRTRSRKWRDLITIELIGAKCSSSAKFQDDIFNAIPPECLVVLGKENRRMKGGVEKYIYDKFTNKHDQLENALDYCLSATPETFDVQKFINSFWHEAGLKRSLDKIYEIIVYSLFSALIEAMDLSVSISVPEEKIDILKEFADFSKSVMCIDTENLVYTQSAHVYRVGVTNAADRGLDMYSNWGPAIQIKHLTLDPTLAESIVTSIASDRIVIVCKEAESSVIVSLLNQIGWKSKIQGIVTEKNLCDWYEKALRGKYADALGANLLGILCEQIALEFPSTVGTPQAIRDRKYGAITLDGIWA